MPSGTINGVTNNVNVLIKVEWSESNVDPANNTSDVSAVIKMCRNDSDTLYWTRGTASLDVSIGGQTQHVNQYVSLSYSYGWVTVATVTKTVPHDANGAKSCAITISGSILDTSVSSISLNGTATLTTIDRESVPSAPASCYFGSAITINAKRASTSYNCVYIISIGQAHIHSSERISADSYTFTIPASWSDVCYNSTSSTLTIACKTYSGTTQIGNTQVTTSTVYVPDSWKPTVTIAKTVSNGGDNGQVLINVSTVNLTASGTAPTGTGISSYSWSGGAVSGTGASKSHSPTSAGTYTYTVTVTDQRGRTGSASVTATAETAYSSMSCAGSVNFGSAHSVTITRKKSSFVHNVTWTINSSYTNTNMSQGTSSSFTIPTSWAASVPTASSINMTVTVNTFNGNTNLGSVSKTVSVVVPSSWVPAFTLSATAVSAFNSQYLKGISKVKLTALPVAPSEGSQIQSYSFTGNNLNKTITTTSTGYDVTSDLLSVVGTNTYTVKVTDKRGRVTTKTTSITVTDYKEPTLNISVGRYTSGGVADNFGEYGRAHITGTYSAVTGNKWTIWAWQKKRTASSYTDLNGWSDMTGAINQTTSLFAADVDSAYDIKVRIRDTVGKQVEKVVALSTGQAIFDVFKDKVAAFFSTASETLRTALGSPATLFYSKAASTYLDGNIYIPQVGSNDGLTDGWRWLNRPYIHMTGGTGGTAGYLRIVRLTVTGAYVNAPIEFEIANRTTPTSTWIILKFANVAGTDPDVTQFGYDGSNPNISIVKAATSTWDIYVQKGENYDNVSVNQVYRPYNTSGVLLKFMSDQVSTLPTGYIVAENIQHLRHRSVRVYGPSPQTLPDLITELRYSNGAMGSLYIGTAYESGNVGIATGWYNYIYIPHREGGLNGAAVNDNCDYGNILLLGMTTEHRFLVRLYNGAVNGLWDLRRLSRPSFGKSWHKMRDGALVAMNTAPDANAVASGLSLKTVSGTWDIGTGGSSVTNADLLYFIYCTDANYSSNTNSVRTYYLNPSNGYMNVWTSGSERTNSLAKTTFSVTNASSSYGSIQAQRCVKLGNFVMLYIWFVSNTTSSSGQPTILNIPSGYRPTVNTYCGVGYTGGAPSAAFAVAAPSGAIQVPADLLNKKGNIMINMVYDV